MRVTHEQVNHLMDCEGAGAVVVQQGVERLELRSTNSRLRTARPGEGGRGGTGGRPSRLGRTCSRLSSCMWFTTCPACPTGLALAPAAISSAPSIIRIILHPPGRALSTPPPPFSPPCNCLATLAAPHCALYRSCCSIVYTRQSFCIIFHAMNCQVVPRWLFECPCPISTAETVHW